MPAGEEIIQRTEFETRKIDEIDERACKVCSVPDVYAKYVRCRAENNETLSKGKKCRLCKTTHDGKFCPDDKNPKIEFGHVIIDTGRKVPRPVVSGLGEFKTNPLKRMIGYEIEVSEFVDGLKCTAVAKKWGCGMVHDCAFEMNTPPANGDKLVDMIKSITADIRKYGAKCKGAGAGLHTHIDVRDANYADIRKIIMLYGKTESALYSIIDPRRASGSMAKPIGGSGIVDMMSDYENYKENISRMVYGGTPGKGGGGRGRSKDPQGGDRYLGFNLHSWWMRGTIEFRMHHGTTKWEKMINWGMLLAGMCQTAMDKGDREIDAWPTGLEGMLAYAPTPAVKQWVQERWDYFAAKRKEKNKPLMAEVCIVPTKIVEEYYPDEDPE